ncbi:hypothetical protein, partial [Pseudomonas citronellolis]|uniref:hypothetical protein n=1 Tax=Pseudomonas citronellolis TaxID=53408 RepID=UPI0023E3F8BF
ALINVLSNMVGGNNNLELMASQLTGVLAAAAVNGDVSKGAEIAKNATAYNRQLHADEERWLRDNAKRFAENEGITEQEAMERLSQQALKDTDYLWRSLLSDGDDNAAQSFLAGSGVTFVNDLGEKQALFTATGQQLFRPEMFADTADSAFYKQFVQSGVSRELSTGLIKELKDSGIAAKDEALDLAKAAREHPDVVLDGLWDGVTSLGQSVVDSFKESGKAIGEGAATAFDADISAKLNAIYGLDVESAQQALLAIRVFTAVSGAKAVGQVGDALAGKAAEAVARKLDSLLDDVAEQTLLKTGGMIGSDGVPILDLKQLTTQQKGLMGELFGENTVKQIIPDGEKLARMPGIGETGIDDLYKVNRPDVDYVVIEYKFVGTDGKSGAQALGGTSDGKQGSLSWTVGRGRLEKAVGEEMAPSIRRSIDSGRTETWVVATRADGATEVQVLDAQGRPKSVDASKILTPKPSQLGGKS